MAQRKTAMAREPRPVTGGGYKAKENMPLQRLSPGVYRSAGGGLVSKQGRSLEPAGQRIASSLQNKGPLPVANPQAAIQAVANQGGVQQAPPPPPMPAPQQGVFNSQLGMIPQQTMQYYRQQQPMMPPMAPPMGPPMYNGQQGFMANRGYSQEDMQRRYAEVLAARAGMQNRGS